MDIFTEANYHTHSTNWPSLLSLRLDPYCRRTFSVSGCPGRRLPWPGWTAVSTTQIVSLTVTCYHLYVCVYTSSYSNLHKNTWPLLLLRNHCQKAHTQWSIIKSVYLHHTQSYTHISFYIIDIIYNICTHIVSVTHGHTHTSRVCRQMHVQFKLVLWML